MSEQLVIKIQIDWLQRHSQSAQLVTIIVINTVRTGYKDTELIRTMQSEWLVTKTELVTIIQSELAAKTLTVRITG